MVNQIMNVLMIKGDEKDREAINKFADKMHCWLMKNPRMVCGVALIYSKRRGVKLTIRKDRICICFYTKRRPAIDWVNQLASKYDYVNLTLRFFDEAGSWYGEFKDTHRYYMD